MVHGTDAVIPVEIDQPSWWVMYPAENNEQLLWEDSHLVDEVREIARIKDLSRNQQIAQRYNLKVVKRNFKTGDFVMRRALAIEMLEVANSRPIGKAHTGLRVQLQKEHTIWKL
jgi:hypothetical protein